MKFSSTTIAAVAILLSSETCAAQAGRNRKVKIYSSSSHLRKAVKDDVVDPYLALPDERAQRSLQELSVSMSLSSSTGSVPTTIGSVPTTIGSLPLTLLEMSMPATIGSVPVTIGSLPTASVQDEVVDPFLGLPDEQGQGGLQELSMPSSIGSVATVLEMSMPTTIGSVPITIGSVPVTIVSAPTTIGSMPVRRRK